MKYQNLVFFPASDALRLDLYKLGLDFLLVRLEGKLQFMIVTNQMYLSQILAAKHQIKEYHVSDSKRQTFKLKEQQDDQHTKDLLLFFSNLYVPTKLGRLSRSGEKSGKAFLVVTEQNATYHYIVE